MFYIRLIPEEPFVQILEKKENISILDVAKKTIRVPDEAELYIETIIPHGLKGEYGFYMDDNALAHNMGLNPVATCLYFNPHYSNKGFNILGDAVIGKFKNFGDFYGLDYMDETQVNEAMKLIQEAMERKGLSL